MAKTKGKYQTSFTTYEEFERIFDSIPEYNRLELAENLDPNLLRMEDNNGWTVAHKLALRGILPERFITEELLRVKNNYGRTVAHLLARSGTLPEKFVTDELLRIKEYGFGWTVAHSLAQSGTLPEKFVTEELLRMEDKDGLTVAYLLANNRILPEKFVTDELLRMKDKDGLTVAHLLANNRILPEKFVTDELLRMEDNNGWTVAHMLAQSGTLPEKFVTEELLRMKDNDGWTVAGCCCIFLSENNRWDMLTPELLAAPYSKTLSVAAFLRRKLTQMGTKNPKRLESAFGSMTRKTKLALLKGSWGGAAAKKIRGDIDREMESEAFETSPDGEQDLHSEEREDLYCGVRSDR